MKKGSVESAQGFPEKRGCHTPDGGLSMLTNLLEYKDYWARTAFDPSADAFRVVGIQDVIDFYGRTPDELREEVKNSVEEYLAWCAEEGAKPEKTWLGKPTIRVDAEGAKTCAGYMGQTPPT
jgi:predicted HicB family RNase H-like nuclease